MSTRKECSLDIIYAYRLTAVMTHAWCIFQYILGVRSQNFGVTETFAGVHIMV